MGAREHEDGVEVVQELHVVSNVLSRTPFVDLFGERPAAPSSSADVSTSLGTGE
jgi:hypothetical protein